MNFYSSYKPVLLLIPEVTDTTILDNDNKAMIKDILEVKIWPAMQVDSSNIYYNGFDLDTRIKVEKEQNLNNILIVLFLFLFL